MPNKLTISLISLMFVIAELFVQSWNLTADPPPRIVPPGTPSPIKEIQVSISYFIDWFKSRKYFWLIHDWHTLLTTQRRSYCTIFISCAWSRKISHRNTNTFVIARHLAKEVAFHTLLDLSSINRSPEKWIIPYFSSVLSY